MELSRVQIQLLPCNQMAHLTIKEKFISKQLRQLPRAKVSKKLRGILPFPISTLQFDL